MFNSNVDGSYGPDSPNLRAIFQDGVSPGADTTIRCDFDVPKEIAEVHVFSYWGDRRLFTWFEVWVSTNNSDYTHVGTATFGESGDPCTNYVNEHCLAILYDTVPDGSLADDVMSIKIRFLGVMDTTWVDLTHKVEGSSGGSTIGEVDIIGIPEPATFLVGCFLLGLAFLRRR